MLSEFYFKGFSNLLTLLLSAALFPTFISIPAFAQFPQTETNPSQLLQQSRTLYENGQFSQAITSLQQAATAFQAIGDTQQQAMALTNLSLAYQQLQQWQDAEAAITKSLNLLQSHPDNSSQDLNLLAQTLTIQGRLHLTIGNPEAALKRWQESAAIYTQLNHQTGITQSQIYQSLALQEIGRYRQALRTLLELNPSLPNQPDSLLKAIGLRSLGNLLRIVGQVESLDELFPQPKDTENYDYLDQSKHLLDLSLTLAQQLQSPQETGEAFLGLGNTARAAYTRAKDAYDRLQIPIDRNRANDEVTAALAAYQQAATTTPSPSTRIQAQLNQLSLAIDYQKWLAKTAPNLAKNAPSPPLNAQLETLPQLQEQIESLPLNRTAIYARINFAQSLTQLLSLTKQNHIKLNSSINNSVIEKLLITAIDQAKHINDKRAQAHALGNLGTLYEQNQQWKTAQTLTENALILSEAIKAKDLAYQWQWQLGRVLKEQGEKQGAIAAYSEAVTSLDSLRGDLISLNNPDLQFSFRDHIEPVYRELVDLLLSPSNETNRKPSQANLKKARQLIEYLQIAELENFLRCRLSDATTLPIDRAIDEQNLNAAIIYPIILENRIEIILKLPQQSELIHTTTFIPKAEVERTIEQLQDDIQEYKTGLDSNSRFRLVYNWLIAPIENDLTQTQQLETLVFVLDGAFRTIPIAALYDGEQYLIETYSIALNLGLQFSQSESWQSEQFQLLTAGLSEARHGFKALPYVEDELAQIQSNLPHSQILLNSAFTRQTFQNQINSQPFGVVHLATHGQFSSSPDETFILAYDQPINVNQLNQFLQTHTENRPDGIELLVLSACQTATGDQRATLGIAGISVRAGARSAIASLFNVNDNSTALLMSQFYQELAQPNVTKAEALRRAQISLLQQENYQSPYYWSPYILVGNWR
ncbi:MAG: CHAT domain-containing protein [Coleofasciculus sp. C1-SOL-03]|uniref:CHAT domain-containing protein n=1 Tax=Coleofasciculus sp. C1-SOL-03 TaxID=3069522 RepID=UPI0032F51745